MARPSTDEERRVRLGQCATKRHALHKIASWAPKDCGYYRVVSIYWDRRSAFDERFRSPYFAFEVEYAHRAKPGFRVIPVGAGEDPMLLARDRARRARVMARYAQVA